jgi:hypothetical protein
MPLPSTVKPSATLSVHAAYEAQSVNDCTAAAVSTVVAAAGPLSTAAPTEPGMSGLLSTAAAGVGVDDGVDDGDGVVIIDVSVDGSVGADGGSVAKSAKMDAASLFPLMCAPGTVDGCVDSVASPAKCTRPAGSASVA